MFRKMAIFFGALILVVFVLVGAAYYYLIKLPLPLTDGELPIKGLRAPVKVFRDRWGVPHIYATDEHDLFLAQGFVQAQDRLWQMETNRRLASGRLSEILGPKTLELDRFLRTLGFMRAAAREVASYDTSSMEILHAFSDGVNAFIESRKGRLPMEFKLLKVQPEPWRPEDSMAWGKVMAYQGAKNWQEEIVRVMLVKKLGMERAQDLLGRIKSVAPAIIPPDLQLDALLPLKQASRSPLIPFTGGASNNWAVSGSRTSTGLPLLANDMHLPLGVPSVWYEMHLVGADIDVMGLSLPGIPLIIAGHNQEVAWGITFSFTDTQDLFFERLSTEKEGKYLHRDEWVQAEPVEEQIRIKGQKTSVHHRIWVTRHGPIISPRLPPGHAPEYALALKWAGHEPGNMLPALSRLNRARNWEGFKWAAQQWSEPPINLVYADRGGNIGYVLASSVPIRAQGHGLGPFAGWTGENEWIGYLSPDQKPFLLNPSEGFVATANNRINGTNDPCYLAADYASGDRENRINEVLAKKKPVSKADFRELQGDYKCLPASILMGALEGIQIEDTQARVLMEKLRSWDQALSPDSIGGAIYSVLFYRLMENTFKDELGNLTEVFFGMGLTHLEPLSRFVEHSRVIFRSLMSDPRSPWFDNIHTPVQENLSDILQKSLNETAVFLKDKLGSDSSKWRWGRLHLVEIRHPMGRIKPLDRILNLGPYEGGGHFCTVWQSAVMPGMDFRLNGMTASNRHIYDLKAWDGSLGAIVPGQSGMFGSPHYDDQVKLWLEVDHHPLHYSRSSVESGAQSVLLLKPFTRIPQGQ
jgi:penicillin amidase